MTVCMLLRLSYNIFYCQTHVEGTSSAVDKMHIARCCFYVRLSASQLRRHVNRDNSDYPRYCAYIPSLVFFHV